MTHPTKKLVCDFLESFSRFEYALKRTDFLKNGARDQAEPDWNKFAVSLDSATPLNSITDYGFKQAVAYFSEHPPKRQVVNNAAALDWEEYQVANDQKNFAELLKLVRRVRNNLFHGGKFPKGYVAGSERDETLIKHSLVILKKCLELEETVQHAYEES